MAALVETMFSYREAPWHDPTGRFVVTERPKTFADARTAAGLDWDVITQPVGGQNADGTWEVIPGWKQGVRDDTGATLSIRPQTYEFITNEDTGMVFEAIMDQPNIKYETGGALKGGQIVWMLAELDEPVLLPGDFSHTLNYIALINHHDGKGGLTARATSVRVVCANTVRAAEVEGERTGATFTFRHTRNWKNRVEEARAAVNGARREFDAYRELAADLLGITITPDQKELFVREFIPTPMVAAQVSVTDRVMRNIEEARAAVRTILNSPTTEPVAHTAFGIFQAGVEYLDYGRTARKEHSAIGRTILGPEPRKAGLLKLVREVVKV